MDIKIDTTGNWPISSTQRARKTTLGEGFTTTKAVVRVVVTGPDADSLSRRSSISNRLEKTKGHEYLPDAMKQMVGLGAEVSITGGWYSVNHVRYFDFGFVMTRRGRGHASHGMRFRNILTELESTGVLREIAVRIVEDEVVRVERMASEETMASRIGAVSAYLIDEMREKANIVTEYTIKVTKARAERDAKMRELCTRDLLEQVALDNHLPLEKLINSVETKMVNLGHTFKLNGD